MSWRRVGAMCWRPVTAIVAGILLAMAYPPVGQSFLAPIALAGITAIAVNSRLRGAIGWSFVSGFVASLWIFHFVSVVGSDAWIGVSVYCALWYLVVGACTWCVAKLPAWPMWVAAAWVLSEGLHARSPYGGFTWGRIAFSQAGAPDVGYAALAGAPLVTFVVVLTGSLLAYAVIECVKPRAQRTAHRALFAAAAICGSVAIYLGGLLVPLPTQGQSVNGPAEVRVAVVQGSVPETGFDAKPTRGAVLDSHVAATLSLARKVSEGQVSAPQFVVWPESSSDLDPLNNQEAARAISLAAEAINAPILVGAATVDPTNRNQRLNVGLVWNPGTGPGEYYIKRHLLPFGEYVPARDLLAKVITRFDRIPYDFRSGQTAGVLQVGPARIGDMICFEVTDDALVRDAVVGGGRALAVPTNNATYTTEGWGGTAEPEQMIAMDSFRAVEHGRAVLVAATSGISAIIAPNGQVVAQSPLYVQDELVATIPLRDSLTLSDRLGAWPELVLSLLALAAVAWGIITRRRNRTAVRTPADANAK